MKIILISPYPDIRAFGIRTLSACLKRENHNVSLVFLPRGFADGYKNKTLEEIVEISKGADLIGISLMTNFFDNVVQITQRLKKDLNIPILWGGIHSTIRPEECLNYADMVCLGEGEETVVELARKMEDGQDCHNIRGLWLKDKGNIVANEMRPLIQDLDSIPFPDYDYEGHYIFDGKRIRKMDEMLLKKYTEKTYVTMPTRGCPFGCSYCANNTLNKLYPDQKPLRKRSVGNIIEELMRAKVKLPFIECVKFDDDAFFVYTVEEMKEFCEKYKENIGLPLMTSGITPSTITREKLSFLVDAGLKWVRMGIQTGSERTKKLYKRYYTNQQVEEAAKIINEFKGKINPPQYDIILDNPWETDEDLIKTLMFLTELPTPYALCLFSLTFYPGTELYEMAKRDGIITDDLRDVYRKHYHSCKKTYPNRLFFLLNDYAGAGSRISPKMMFWLTSRKLLYYLLKFGAIRFKKRQLEYLLHEGLKDIRKGDWSRIIWYIKEI